MSKRSQYTVIALAVAVVTAVVIWIASGGHLAVLDPKGAVAAQQRDLLYVSVALMLLVVIPVFVLTFYISWKYRAGNKHARYSPDWDGDRRLEILWWGFPTLIIVILSVIIWQSSHALDPYRPLSNYQQPLTVQVVALQWKWLFIYPDQNIASVNYLQIPEDMPVRFEITADAPMNSFWIPQLGGQVYAMAGMTTNLHLIANETGKYRGSSANLSGSGFADMNFVAEATSHDDFDAWVQSVRRSPDTLSRQAYDELARPSRENPVFTFASTEPNLHTTIVGKYSAHKPGHGHPGYGQPTDAGGQDGGAAQQPHQEGRHEGQHEGH